MFDLKLRIRLGISLLVAGSVATSSIASDRTQCHDLPAKQTVLDEGKELLRQQGSESRSRLNFHNMPPEKRFFEEFPNPYFPNFDYSNEPDANVHLKLPLQTLVQVRDAMKTAETLERYCRANLANTLLTRILSSNEFSKLESREQAAVLENAARTEIEWGLKKETESPDSFRDRIFLSDHLYFIAMAFMTPLRLRYFTLDATTRTSMTDESVMRVKNLYLRAVSIRSKLKLNEELSTDLLMLGALSEKTNDLSSAAKYFSQALATIEKLSKTIVVAKNDSTEKKPWYEEDKKLSDDALAVIVSTQIRAGLVNDNEEEASRSVKLFEEKCLNPRPGSRIIVSVQCLLSILDVLPSADAPALVDYLRTVIHDKNQTTVIATNFSTILEKMKARGWGTECNTVCEYATSQSDTDKLLMVANWYAGSKEAAHLINTAKMILLAIKTDSNEQALASLNLLTPMLASISTAEPNLANVKSEAARITAYHEDEIRRKQCLHMADKLNQTAFALERKAQPAMASKLYKEALEIKQINLKLDDPETAAQLIDLARSEAAQRHFEDAQTHYEKALAMMRKNAMVDPSDIVSALESYGMMLNDWNRGAKAAEVYEEAKALHRKMKQPKIFAR